MEAFDVLGDPVRRRILELLATGEHTSGGLTQVIAGEFGISQPAVSMQLKVLRDSGFATVRADGARRIYAVSAEPLAQVDGWLEQFRPLWEQRLDALGTEIARGAREKRRRGPARQPTVSGFGVSPAGDEADDDVPKSG
ncbi:ArsR/SmtB family transcription factor [Nakamurella lactea]|uniref:ArsR/SmtB family transcription factor n=1 Tax=Nakamurella lactea TaxID=459515 RepID=UPI0004235E1F|nr:metalloregulator ArsR/SmtB family transcription factor [Nakamurella lactea]